MHMCLRHEHENLKQMHMYLRNKKDELTTNAFVLDGDRLLDVWLLAQNCIS